MKKISFIAIVGLLVLSCTKSTVDLEIHPSPVDKEELVEVGRTANIVLYASVDKEVETKLSATEEDGHVEFKFEENDELSTFFVAGDKKDVNVKFTYKDGKFVPDEGQLYTTLDGNMPAVYGIYPYEKEMSAVTDLTKVPVSIPQVQMYDPSTYKENGNLRYPKNYSRFVAKPTTLKEVDGSYYIDTDFFTMGSMIKLQVQNSTGESLSIRSVNIYGASGLAGDFTTDLTADPSFSNTEYKLSPVDGGNQYNHVCVSFGNDGFTLPVSTRMPVYAFVNAADFDGDGFSMTVSTDKGTYQADFESRKEGVDGFARNARYTYTVDLNSERLIDRLIGSDYVARYLDSNNEWQYKETLSDAISNVPANGIVELVKDAAHGTGDAIILTGKTFTLNGNGHTYDVSGRTNNVFFHSSATTATDVTFRNIKFKSTETAESPNSKRLIQNQKTNSTITLAEGTEIEGIYYNGANGGIVYNNGTINIDGAKITNCGVVKNGDSGGNGGFIYSISPANSTAKVNFNSGEISNCTSAGSGGVFYICAATGGNGPELNVCGGEISNCSAGASGGVFYNAANAKVNFYDGNISDCSATNYGGVFYNYTNSELNVYGGRITNCTSSSNGSLIYVSNASAASGATVNLYGGEFSCTAGYAAIYGYTGEAKITIGRENDPSSCPKIVSTSRCIFSYGDVKIYNCDVQATGGAAVSLVSSKCGVNLEIFGGDIESTTTNAVSMTTSDNHNFNAEIRGGRFKSGGTSSVIYTASNLTEDILEISGGYFSKEVKSAYLKKADETAGTRAYKNYPNDEYNGYPYKVEEQHAAIFENGSERVQKATIEEALNAANDASGECSVILCEDVSMPSKIDIKNTAGVTFDLNGNTLTQKSASRLGVTESGYLKIIDSRGDGKIIQSAADYNTFLISSGTLEIAGGSIEQATSATVANIVASGSANLKVSGGDITSVGTNTVSFTSSGVLTVANGNIVSKGSSSTNIIAAISVTGSNSGKLNMNGGLINVPEGSGYGLYVNNSSFTGNVTNGKITSKVNYAFYMRNGDLTIADGDFYVDAQTKSVLYVHKDFDDSINIEGGNFVSEQYAPVLTFATAGSITISGPAYLYGGDTANGYIVRKGTGAIDITGVTDGFFGGAYASFAKDYVNVKCASGFHVGNIKTPVTKGDKKYACKIYAD